MDNLKIKNNQINNAHNKENTNIKKEAINNHIKLESDNKYQERSLTEKIYGELKKKFNKILTENNYRLEDFTKEFRKEIEKVETLDLQSYKRLVRVVENTFSNKYNKRSIQLARPQSEKKFNIISNQTIYDDFNNNKNKNNNVNSSFLPEINKRPASALKENSDNNKTIINPYTPVKSMNLKDFYSHKNKRVLSANSLKRDNSLQNESIYNAVNTENNKLLIKKINPETFKNSKSINQVSKPNHVPSIPRVPQKLKSKDLKIEDYNKFPNTSDNNINAINKNPNNKTEKDLNNNYNINLNNNNNNNNQIKQEGIEKQTHIEEVKSNYGGNGVSNLNIIVNNQENNDKTNYNINNNNNKNQNVNVNNKDDNQSIIKKEFKDNIKIEPVSKTPMAAHKVDLKNLSFNFWNVQPKINNNKDSNKLKIALKRKEEHDPWAFIVKQDAERYAQELNEKKITLQQNKLDYLNVLKSQIEDKEKMKNVNKSLETQYYKEIVLKTFENENEHEKIKAEEQRRKQIQEKQEYFKTYEGK